MKCVGIKQGIAGSQVSGCLVAYGNYNLVLQPQKYMNSSYELIVDK